MKKILLVCTTDSMIWNFLIPHIRKLEEMGFYVECVCSKTGFYFDELINKYNLKVNIVPFYRSPFKIGNIKAYSTLKSFIRKTNPDFIFCHEPVGGALARLAGKKERKKIIYLAHGFHFFKKAPLKHWILYFAFEYILSFKTDAIITICSEDYENAKKLHCKSVYCIPGIGVDFSRFCFPISSCDRIESRRNLSIDDDTYVIVSVGELSKRKNHMVILKAIKDLKDMKIVLLICGEGGEKANLMKFCLRNNIMDKVLLLGFRKDVSSVLCAADLFVFPSLWEGLGLAGIEAMYMGLPIIASNRQGIKDYVINDETGFLFEPKDYKTLRGKICFAYNNRDYMKRIGSNGHNYVKKYSLDNSISSLESIISKETNV